MTPTLENMLQSLADLRATGVDQFAPVRFQYLEAMAQRTAGRQGLVAERLVQRLLQGLEQYREDYQAVVQTAAMRDAVQLSNEAAQAFVELQDRLQQTEVAVSEGAPIVKQRSRNPVTLKSVDVLRDTWVKLKQSQRVTDAICQPPEHAGPLNSHRLVIRSLETLREVSPAYLEQFMEYVDTILLLQPAAPETANRKKPTGSKKRKA